MCLLQHPGCLKKDKWESLLYSVDVQANTSFCWQHRSYCRFCRALAHICSVWGESSISYWWHTTLKQQQNNYKTVMKQSRGLQGDLPPEQKKTNHLTMIWARPQTLIVSCQPLWKHAYSNILKISPPKTESFQRKILIFFSYYCSKHKWWVTAEAVLTSTHNLCFWAEKRTIMYTPVNPSFTI